MATSYAEAGLLGQQSPTPGGRIMTGTDAGKKPPPMTGPKHVPGMSSAQVAAAVVPETPPKALSHPPGQPKNPSRMPAPGVPTRPQFSANNPMPMVQAPPPPHPGVQPPYPDARSQQPTMMPNGQMIMPMPKGFPLGSSGLLHVPRVMAQGMTGLLHTQ